MWAKLGLPVPCPAWVFLLSLPLLHMVVGGGSWGLLSLASFLLMLTLRPVFGYVHTSEYSPTPGPFCPDRTGPAEAQPSPACCCLLSSLPGKATGLRRPKLPSLKRPNMPAAAAQMGNKTKIKKKRHTSPPPREASFEFL